MSFREHLWQAPDAEFMHWVLRALHCAHLRSTCCQRLTSDEETYRDYQERQDSRLCSTFALVIRYSSQLAPSDLRRCLHRLYMADMAENVE
jgi:hypothetical protein